MTYDKISRARFENALKVFAALALEHVNEADLAAIFLAAGFEIDEEPPSPPASHPKKRSGIKIALHHLCCLFGIHFPAQTQPDNVWRGVRTGALREAWRCDFCGVIGLGKEIQL